MDQRTSGSDIPIGTTRASELNESGGRGTTDTVRDKAREIGHIATERAQAAIGQQKERATSELGAVAFALRDAATRLEGDNMMSGRFIRTAAERLDDFSRRLESRDLDGLMWETRAWARRNPAVFMGAAVALGFLASRFLKASEEPRSYGWEGDELEEDYTPWAADAVEYPASDPLRTSGRDYTTGTGSATPSGTGFTPGNTTGSGQGGTHGHS
ncbi:MAG TPA: hypothetical protein VGF40_14645 [Thermoanaerobaculia bacterium]